MKKLFENKYLLFVVAFLLGSITIWVFKPTTSESVSAASHEHANEEQVWTCSMHPQIRQNEPGSCPICGMDLIPVDETVEDEVDPMAVSMSPTAMQLANVATATVKNNVPVKSIRLNGKVQEDERLISSQTSHFSGRVEKLYINFTGDSVSKGSTIGRIYSPELVTAQEELLEALKFKEKQPAIYKAAREKLKNWKLSDAQIDQILSTGAIKENFALQADQSGYVITKNVNLGDYVQRGQTLYEIANLSRVWLLFDIYENDLPWIRKGDSVTFSINSLPGRSFTAKIEYIDPIINPKTRVAKARVVMNNDKQELKPEMFVSGVVKTTLDKNAIQIIVPKSAVMWTGERSIVYVRLKTDQGLYFKMREVTLGPALGDSYVIKDGLEEGEEIAVNGTFSIDAAAQLANKPSMMNSLDSYKEKANSESDSHTVSDIEEINVYDSVLIADAEFKNQLKDVFNAYLKLKEALVLSDKQEAIEEVRFVKERLNKITDPKLRSPANEAWKIDAKLMRNRIDDMLQAKNIEKIREEFYPLSEQLFHTLKKFDVEIDAFLQYCPMAFNNKGAYWLSAEEEIRNPYFGDAMLTCGNVEEEL